MFLKHWKTINIEVQMSDFSGLSRNAENNKIKKYIYNLEMDNISHFRTRSQFDKLSLQSPEQNTQYIYRNLYPFHNAPVRWTYHQHQVLIARLAAPKPCYSMT